MQNTTFNPTRLDQMDTLKAIPQAQGINHSFPAGQTTSFDWVPNDDYIILGADLQVANAVFGDLLTVQIVDANGITGVAPGTVVASPVTNWNEFNGQVSHNFASPEKIMAGMHLRFTVTSNGLLNPVNMGINLHSYLVLV